MSNAPSPSERGAGSSPCAVIIRGDVLAEIERHMSVDTAFEHGGVLVGTADPVIGLVIVTAAAPLPEGGTQTVAFSRDVWEQMTRLVIDRHPGERIVGWYHSHPRFGIFFSGHDLLIHTTYFSQPWQVGYVYDPVQEERGFFGWLDHDLVRIPRWEVTSTRLGVATSLPANAPAHGPSVAGRQAAAVGPLAFAESLASPPATAMSSFGVVLPTGQHPVVGPAGTGPAKVSLAEVPPARRRTVAIVIAALVVIIALVALVALIIANRGDDSAGGTTTSAATTSTVKVITPVVPTTSPPTISIDSIATATVADTEPVATTTTVSVATTAVAQFTTPLTPTVPAARVGPSAVACVTGSNGVYTPSADCFVALTNGNIVLYSAGKLTCVDPVGQLLGPATSFVVGFNGDPIVVVADGKVLPKCSDVTYAKNVLGSGSGALAGLCGSSSTPIDAFSTRCFSQNTTNGSMIALVKGFVGDIVGLCFSPLGPPAPLALVWSTTGVDATWRIDSVAFDVASNQFTAFADRSGASATAPISCG